MWLKFFEHGLNILTPWLFLKWFSDDGTYTYMKKCDWFQYCFIIIILTFIQLYGFSMYTILYTYLPNTLGMAYLFYSSLRFTQYVDSNLSAFWKTYTNILCIYRIFFTPCNTCKGFSLYHNTYSTLGGWQQRYSLQVKKKRNYFLSGISLKPNHSDGGEELTFIHCNVPCSPMVSQHHEYGFCCLPRAHIHTQTRTPKYAFTQLTK